MKYVVTLQYERTELIEVEAESPGDAREIVANGEFEQHQIIDAQDDYVDIIDVRTSISTRAL
jgi:hypothetical protein